MRASSSTSNSERARRLGILSVVLPAAALILAGAVMGRMFRLSHTSYVPAWANAPRPVTGVVLGSSMAEAGYRPRILEVRKGDLVYNLGSSGQQPDSSFFLLKDVLSRQRPRWVILDIYWVILEGDLDFSQLANTYEHIVSPAVKNEVFWGGFSWKSKVYYLLPVLRYRQDFYWWMEENLNRIRSAGAPVGAPSDAGPGAEAPLPAPPAAEAATPAPASQNLEVIPPDLVLERNKFRNYRFKGFKPRPLEYIARIIELCSKENIRLFVASVPILPQSAAYVDDYPRISNELKGFLADHGQQYLDLNLTTLSEHWLDPADYADENHPNDRGAEIISRRIVNDLPLD